MGVLKTYIYELDRLFHPVDEYGKVCYEKHGIQSPIVLTADLELKPKESVPERTLTISLAGAAGTGKSILALHFAAAFLVENPGAFVMYISTDLSHGVAKRQMESFGLGKPGELWEFFERPKNSINLRTVVDLPKVEWGALGDGTFLRSVISPESIIQSSLSTTTVNKTAEPDISSVHFVDFQEGASGDDWLYLEEFLSKLLPLMEKIFPQRKVLLVIDAIEGLDTPGSGELPISRHGRRQRLARLMETTTRNANIVFTLEATEPNLDVDEEFVSDVAIHLNRDQTEHGSRTTLEVKKARGMYVYSGVHELVIRGNRGTTTDEQVNEDDPDLPCNKVLLLPSLSVFEQRLELKSAKDSIAWPDNSVVLEPCNLKFGIPALDEMLSEEGGLGAGGIHLILGEEYTHTSKLITAFLSQGCYRVYELLMVGAKAKLRPDIDLLGREFRKAVIAYLPDVRRQLLSQLIPNSALPQDLFGTGLLFSSGRSVTARSYLNGLIENWNAIFQVQEGDRLDVINAKVDESGVKEVAEVSAMFCTQFLAHKGVRSSLKAPRPFIYRRMPSRPLSKEMVYFIILENMKAAIVQQIIGDYQIGMERTSGPSERPMNPSSFKKLNADIARFCQEFPRLRYPHAWRVRVAFEEISTLLSSIPQEDRETLTAAIVDLCRVTGVTALFTDKQQGGPLGDSAQSSTGVVHARTESAIYTWHVPYGSGSKVAIAKVPPVSREKQVVVRELRGFSESQRLEIDRCLELYLDVIPSHGAELEDLRRVPLTVLLGTEGELWGDRSFETQCADLLRSSLGDSFHLHRPDSSDVLHVESMPGQVLESFVNYSLHAAEPRTVVAMIDEYWSRNTREWFRKGQSRAKDRFLELDAAMVGRLRHQEFDNDVQPIPDEKDERHRRLIPFTWNFGLSLLRMRPWEFAAAKVEEGLANSKAPKDVKVKEVLELARGKFDVLPKVCSLRGTGESLAEVQANSEVAWHEFFAACQYVKRFYSAHDDLQVFEIDAPDSQSLVSFVLEVWMSTVVWFYTKIEHLPSQKRKFGPNDTLQLPNAFTKCLACLSKWDVTGAHRKLLASITNLEKDDFAESKSLFEVIDEGIRYLNVPPPNSMQDAGNVIADSEEADSAVYIFCLYLTLLTLSQVVDFHQWVLDPNTFIFKPRTSTGKAVAGRYWYATASFMLRRESSPGVPNFDPNDPMVPMALPGYFSARGDWHLAVLASSRSIYLGELAIHELSRSKAATIRLQTGVGLPMYNLVRSADRSPERQVRTALPSPFGGKMASFDYGYVKAIAPLRYRADRVSRKIVFPGHEGYFPIYRSEIKGYIQETSLFSKGLTRILVSLSEAHREGKSVDFYDVFEELADRLKGREDLRSIVYGVEATEEETNGESVREGLGRSDTWTIFNDYFSHFRAFLEPHKSRES
ncbi:RAD55 family ATPase [Fimbriimonas ginsengisoli]|uniref:KaiC-like domain-containing protein n=1 Tax=Fimbriimonas ginsengisoli Gsoil 348 TaxID=661478 RepID=A0A068NUF1_FIMGI|nr:hypothetical protein [Fimbriimonas ginsengisoli]AIE86405.1 hypothetical protein OP10G_3037 [Fimbriimonas ginsengisoli Gsoil 348]